MLPMCVCPMWLLPGLGTPRKSVTPPGPWGWGGMQEGTESQGTTQPGTGDAPLLLPIHEGFWIWRRGAAIMSKSVYNRCFYNSKIKWQCDNIKGFAQSDEPTESFHLNLQLPLTLRSFIASFSSLFRPQLYKKKSTVHYLLSTKQQTDRSSGLQMNYNVAP